MKEARLQKIMISLLNVPGVCRAWRNTGGAYQLKESDRWITYGVGGRGAPDIIGFDHQKKFYGVEVKGEGGTLRKHQQHARIDFETHGVHYFVAWPVNALEIALRVVGPENENMTRRRWARSMRAKA